MGQLSSKLRGGAGRIYWWCPGCEEVHGIRVATGDQPGGWAYNGNPNSPTFEPSVLVTSGHFMEGREGKPCWCGKPDPDFKCARCHTFVRDGMIQFLGDCSHALAGQKVPMPDLPPHLTDGSYGWPE